MSVGIHTSKGFVQVAGLGMGANQMIGATETADGKGGIVPAPRSSDKDKFLKGDGTWGEVKVEASTEEILEQTGKYVDEKLETVNDKITELSEKVAVLDSEDNENVTDGVVSENSHSHDNKSVLDKLSESSDGVLLFDGNEIQGGSGETVDLSAYATIEYVNEKLQNVKIDFEDINVDFEEEDIDFSTDY